MLDVLAQFVDLLLGEVLNAGIGIDADFGDDLFRGGKANTEDVGNANLNALFPGQVYARNTCHTCTSVSSG